MPQSETDLLGKSLDDHERELMDVYNSLKKMAADSNLPPCASRNVKAALSAIWQATNDLGLQFEQLYDVGV
jgi:hypothetical protein